MRTGDADSKEYFAYHKSAFLRLPEVSCAGLYIWTRNRDELLMNAPLHFFAAGARQVSGWSVELDHANARNRRPFIPVVGSVHSMLCSVFSSFVDKL